MLGYFYAYPTPRDRIMIAFCTTCKGRAQHVAETLPRNLRDNPNSIFILLDYGDTGPDLRNVVESLRQYGDRLKFYRHEAPVFHMSHAKNMAARLAIREGADILVTCDADNWTGPGFEQFVEDNLKSGSFLCPDFETIQAMPWGEGSERPLRGFAGRLAVRSQDWIKAGGYNETYDTWRGEDIDFNARMGRMGYKSKFIPVRFLNSIPHGAEVRFKEWSHAKQYEKPGGWRIEGNHTDTVVNYGKIGVGTVQKYGEKSSVEIKPAPTRVFGIGMQKTATTSLHEAFRILGFDSLHWGEGTVATIWQEVNSAGRSVALERFYAACDNPIPLFYRKLDKAYPGSKFILTIRDEAKWLKSVERMWNPEFNPTRWMWDVWPISNRIHKALYGRADFNVETMLTTYRRHSAEAREYFKGRPNDLLVMDMDRGAGWLELCGFLNCSVPNQEYPTAYATRKHDNFSSC
jgi:Sulfotransferase domain/N-terminal domain of galactosyltransferase